MPDFIADPAWINAFFAGVVALVTALFVRGRANGNGKAKAAVHQELIRPETEAEKATLAAAVRAARAQEQMVDVLSKIERHLDILIKVKGG